MARICSSCGRALSPDEHDVVRDGEKELSAWVDGIDRRGEARIQLSGGRRRYGCRVRLIATSPYTGKTFIPARPAPRFKDVDQRYVHESRFKTGDLA